MTVNILPNAKSQFIDANGAPLASGRVYMYVPGTTTLKTTWQDSAGTTPNGNPIPLDASGQCIIFGSGAYRQIVQDSLGNTIWDQVTVDPGYAIATSFSGTSITSNLIAIGTKNFVTQPGLVFFAGQPLIIASNANSSNFMFGQITSYNITTGALVMNITDFGGSGTYADWNISISGLQGPTGTVSSVSVNTANGFAGTSSGGSTPALTIQTTVTGLVKGNGTAVSAATSGTDYAPGTSGLATGIVKSTNTTGALSIAVAGDFPTLNQNTTGTANNVVTNANLTGPITSVGNATSVTAGGITEAAFGFTDVTTANVTTLKHGLTPKLPGSATVYLDGSGAYSTPPLTLTLGSSTTSLTIGTGTKIYTTQAGLAITAGQFLITPSAANATNYMFGQVTSYTGTTLTMNITATGGSGTLADWNIAPSGPQGNAGVGTGTVNSGTSAQLTYYGATGTTVSGNANATITNGDLVLGQSGTQGSVAYSGSSTGSTQVKAAAAASGTLTLPAATDTLVGKATTDTLTNKTLTAPVIATISNSGTLTLPTTTDTIVGRATTDTLTNKTLTAPVISTITNSGTLTLPTTTTTLVGRNTTDTLTNKTIVAGSNTISGITEAMQSLSDVTTANVTTSAHGYAPKLPNDATKFLDGTGNYSAPAAGALVLLNVQTASASTSIDFNNTYITSTYDDYVLTIDGLIPSLNGIDLWLRTSSNNGVSYDSGASNYAYGSPATAAAFVTLISAATNSAAVGIAGTIKFYNLNSSTVYKRFSWDISGGTASGGAAFIQNTNSGARIATAAVNAIRIVISGATITTGTFKLYGIAKT